METAGNLLYWVGSHVKGNVKICRVHVHGTGLPSQSELMLNVPRADVYAGSRIWAGESICAKNLKEVRKGSAWMRSYCLIG